MKRIAVLLIKRKRYSEGLRMAAGLSLLGDNVDIYLMDNDFESADRASVSDHLEMMKAVGIGMYANFKKNGFDFISTADIGRKFAEYDYIIPY
ncbi:MAG: hypothetical protein ACYC40_04630 [Patescibacteria group bacterium]